MSGLLVSLQDAVVQGVLWGIMVLGVYITYKLLDIADLTVDGSFAMGGCVCAVMILNFHVDPWVSLGVAAAAGMAAGAVTGLLHTIFEIPAILAGILTQIGLWSINLRIMGGKSNVPLLKTDTIMSKFIAATGLSKQAAAMIIGIGIAIVMISFLYWFFGTEIGSAMRATGNNQAMIRAQGVNTNWTKLLALTISNGLVGLSGGLVCQSQKYADIGMGTGAIVIGLAAIVIGDVLMGKLRSFASKLISAVVGSVIYFVIRAMVLRMGMDANDMKLLSAAIVAVALCVPVMMNKWRIKKILYRRRRITVLDIKNVRKTFNKNTINEKKALNGIDLHLNEGDFVTVIGGNGAGKSTMLNMIAGVYPIDSGKIQIDEINISRDPEYKRAKYIGRVFQDPMLGTAAGMEIQENMALAYRRGQGRGLAWGIRTSEKSYYYEALKKLGLGLQDRMTNKVGLLSGGQRQALTLLMATLKKPKLLLLDEHTAALDPKTAKKVLEITQEIVKEQNLTTLMITHNMKDAIQIGNRLVMMHEGRIIYDVSGEEKKKLEVEDLLKKFEEASGEEFSNDRMILAK